MPRQDLLPPRRTRYTTSRYVMIENLRKYPGVILAALVTVFFGFLFMDTQSFFRKSSGSNVISVDGISYGSHEYDKLGPSSRGLASQLTSYQSMTMYEFSMAMINPKAQSREAAEKSFFINRMILQKAGREFGIVPGEDEIQKFIRERSVFTDTDPTDPGKKTFNKENYDSFVMKQLGKNGQSEADLFNLVKDVLIYEKLSTILGGSLQTNLDSVKQRYQVNTQKVTASYVTLNLADFASKQNPSEEDVKKFWEERKDSYKTETRRKFSYVIGTPTYEPGQEKAPEPPKAAKVGDPVPPPSEADKAITEGRRKAELKVAAVMDDLLFDIEESKGSDFEKKAAEFKWTVRTTDLFTSTTIPTELLTSTPRKTDKTMQQLLFDMKVTADPISKFTSSFPVGEADWMIARLDGEEESRVKTYDEAKEEAKKQLIDEKAKEAMKLAAEDTRKKLQELVKAGKSFADAAKETGLTIASIGPIGAQETPAGAPNATTIFAAAKLVTPGELTENTIIDGATLIIHVDKRELTKDANLDSILEGGVEQEKRSLRYQVFQAWIAERNSLTKVSP